MDEQGAVNQRRWHEMAKLHEQTYFADGARIRDETLTLSCSLRAIKE